MGLRPDLTALAASTPNDDDHRSELQGIADAAMEAAGSSRGANLGISLHRFTHAYDRAPDSSVQHMGVPSPLDVDLATYGITLRNCGYQIDTRYIERMTVCPDLNSAGTFDRLLLCPDGFWRVADLKTQKDPPAKYSGLSHAVQLAVYANGMALWNPKDKVYEAYPEPMDRSYAIIIWLPVGKAHCELLPVDLVRGAQYAGLAAHVRDVRKSASTLIGTPLNAPGPEYVPVADRVAEVIAIPDGIVREALLKAADDAGVFDPPPSTNCPTCTSPSPELHPQGVICPDAWHKGIDAEVGRAVLDGLQDRGPGQAAEALTAGALNARRQRVINSMSSVVDTRALIDLSKLYADIWNVDMQKAAAQRWEELTT